MIPDVSSEEAPFVEGVKSFLGSKSTSELAKKQLAAFMEQVTIHSTVENYAQDMDRRIDLIKLLQKKIHAFHPGLNFNLMQVAFLLQLDLVELSDYVEEDNMTDIMQILKSVEVFLKACLGESSYLDKPLNKESKRELSCAEDPSAKRARGDASHTIAVGISAALPSETEEKSSLDVQKSHRSPGC